MKLTIRSPHYAYTLPLFLLLAIANNAQAQETAQTTGTIDRELLNSAKEEKLNLFLDATDTEAGDTRSIQDAKAAVTIAIDRTKQLAAGYGLSVLEDRPQTLLSWRRPDVLGLAHKIVEGEKIQFLELPKAVLEAAYATDKTEEDAPENKNRRGSTYVQDPLLFSPLKEIAALKSKLPQPELLPVNVDANDGATIVKTSISLDQLSQNNRLITGAFTQYYLLRAASGPAKDMWLTDEYWKDVEVLFQQMPNQVVRRADVGKPRTMIPILSVEGKVGINKNNSLVSSQALAVLPTTP